MRRSELSPEWTLVYERLGLRLLRTAWINLDLVWSIAFTGTAVLTVLT